MTGHEEPTDDERYLRGTWRTDKKGAVAKGVVATLTMGVDPEATQAGTSAG